MREFHHWLRCLKLPVAIGYPILFDGMWVHWYMMNFCKTNPLSFSGIDIKTLAWAAMGGDYRQVAKRRMPRDWFRDSLPHSHVAVEDAREQGKLFFRIREHLLAEKDAYYYSGLEGAQR